MGEEQSDLSLPQLQPLRIPHGWAVLANTFFEADPPNDLGSEAWWLLQEGLLQLRHPQRQLLVTLGWHPAADPAGSFRLVVVLERADPEQMAEAWASPLEQHESRSRAALVAMLEAVLLRYALGPAV